MKFTTVCAIISAFATQQVAADIDDYLALTAQQKQDEIWTAVLEDTMPLSWYGPVTDAKVFTENMDPTMQGVGDEMPTSHGKERKKLTHTVGTNAKFTLTNIGDHPFTGSFKSGTQTGVMRLSMAAEPNPKVDNIIPSVSLKFFRDGIDSANMLGMNSIDGQTSWNVFKYDWFTHLPVIQTPILAKLGDHFSTASNYVQALGVSAIAQYNEDGTLVEDVVFPYSVRFEPTDTMRNKFPDTYTDPFADQYLTIEEGTLLFNIYGYDAPTELGGVEYHIGELITTSQMTTSHFGDQTLFFRHQPLEQDLVLKPEWTDYEPYYVDPFGIGSDEATQGKPGCPFAHLWE